MDLPLPDADQQLPSPAQHPVALALKCSNVEILDALGGGFRLLVAVRGRLAEEKLRAYLEESRSAGEIDAFEMLDEDGKPDARVEKGGLTRWIEVKMVHPETLKNGTIVVEPQKTRASKGDKASRFYPVDHFDVLAACLFNVTGEWTFVFARSRDLRRHVEWADRLNPIQRIPQPLDPAGVWRATLQEVLR